MQGVEKCFFLPMRAQTLEEIYHVCVCMHSNQSYTKYILLSLPLPSPNARLEFISHGLDYAVQQTFVPLTRTQTLKQSRL